MKTLREAGVQPLDLILFKGVDPVSHAICFAELKERGRGDYSHVGLAVTRDVLDLPFLEPDRVYVWESTLSAPKGFLSHFTDQVPDAETRDKARFGVQLRDLELVIPGYVASGGKVAWSAFKGPRPPYHEAQPHMQSLYEEFGHALYEVNLLDLFGVVFPALRGARDRVEHGGDRVAHFVNHVLEKAHRHKRIEDADHHVFCSEWVAKVYHRLELLEIEDPRVMAPIDFLANDLFEEPVPLVPEEEEGSGI